MSGERSGHDLVGWTRRGRAKVAHRQRDTRARLADPVLPDRENTLALGAELLSVRRGGGTAKVSADELMMEALIARALKGNLAAVVDLYARLDREEDAATANPVLTLSPYMRRKALDVVRDLVRAIDRMRYDLMVAGLADIVDGKLVVSDAARRAYIARSQAA